MIFIPGFSERSVRAYRKEFFENGLKFEESRQGKHERLLILSDENLRRDATKWVRENAFRKGSPNMTALEFTGYVNNILLPSHHLPPHFPCSISFRTAVRWLHRLGFKPMSHKKGIYIDGHEHDDVVKYRGEYLKTIEDYQNNHMPRSLCSNEKLLSPSPSTSIPSERHDKKIFNVNEARTWMWGSADKPAILPKTKGSGIMISDFIDEHNGYLRLSTEELEVARASNPTFPEQARELFEYGAARSGYWTVEKFVTN